MLARLQRPLQGQAALFGFQTVLVKSARLQLIPGEPTISPIRNILRAYYWSSASRSLHHVREEQSDFLEDFIRTTQPEKKAINHFSSKPWTRAIVEDEAYEVVPFYSRHVNESTGENRFFAQTVNTKTAVPHVLAFRRKDIQMAADRSSNESEVVRSSLLNSTATLPEIRCLMRLEKGLDSHPSIVNGGFQCVLFDEVAWFVILVHQNAISEPGPRDIHYTLNMTTKYLGPVKTPADVLIRANLIRKEGRKWFTYAEIVDELGKVLTSSESLWLTAKKP